MPTEMSLRDLMINDMMSWSRMHWIFSQLLTQKMLTESLTPAEIQKMYKDYLNDLSDRAFYEAYRGTRHESIEANTTH